MNLFHAMIAGGLAALLFDLFIIVVGYCLYRNRKWRLKKKQNSGKWTNVIEGNEVHTVPINDKMTHYTANGDNCACSPKTIPVPREDGSFGWQIVHDALDGRI